MKNEKDLTKKQSQKLAQVKEVSPSLKTMHELKEKIRQIFDETNDWLDGLFKLGTWLSEAQNYLGVALLERRLVRFREVSEE
ncbi:MAG: transposase [Moorea sp. SIO4E2]|nr:transposase [Moorena sp. SIO4E2]